MRRGKLVVPVTPVSGGGGRYAPRPERAGEQAPGGGHYATARDAVGRMRGVIVVGVTIVGGPGKGIADGIPQ